MSSPLFLGYLSLALLVIGCNVGTQVSDRTGSDAAAELQGIDLTAGTASLQVCPGVSVRQDAQHPAAAAIQTCIDKTPAGGTLALPVGTWVAFADQTRNDWVVVTGNKVIQSGLAFNKAPETNNATLNQQYNAIAAENVGPDGAQIAGTLGYYGGNETPAGWSVFDTSKACPTPKTKALVPGVFGTCPGFPAP